MDERKQIAEDTLDQLIEQALRELDRVEPDGLAEERMSDISDEIRRDLRLEETQRTLMLDTSRSSIAWRRNSAVASTSKGQRTVSNCCGVWG